MIMRDRTMNRNRKRIGFTLIELVVVILILGVLAAMIVPRIIGRGDDAKVAAAKGDLATLATLLDLYRNDTGEYPTTEDGLLALLDPPPDIEGWRGPYPGKSEIPLDPWGYEYIYEYPGMTDDSFVLLSLGKDGEIDGEGPNADLIQRE